MGDNNVLELAVEMDAETAAASLKSINTSLSNQKEGRGMLYGARQPALTV